MFSSIWQILTAIFFFCALTKLVYKLIKEDVARSAPSSIVRDAADEAVEVDVDTEAAVGGAVNLHLVREEPPATPPRGSTRGSSYLNLNRLELSGRSRRQASRWPEVGPSWTQRGAGGENELGSQSEEESSSNGSCSSDSEQVVVSQQRQTPIDLESIRQLRRRRRGTRQVIGGDSVGGDGVSSISIINENAIETQVNHSNHHAASHEYGENILHEESTARATATRQQGFAFENDPQTQIKANNSNIINQNQNFQQNYDHQQQQQQQQQQYQQHEHYSATILILLSRTFIIEPCKLIFQVLDCSIKLLWSILDTIEGIESTPNESKSQSKKTTKTTNTSTTKAHYCTTTSTTRSSINLQAKLQSSNQQQTILNNNNRCPSFSSTRSSRLSLLHNLRESSITTTTTTTKLPASSAFGRSNSVKSTASSGGSRSLRFGRSNYFHRRYRSRRSLSEILLDDLDQQLEEEIERQESSSSILETLQVSSGSSSFC